MQQTQLEKDLAARISRIIGSVTVDNFGADNLVKAEEIAAQSVEEIMQILPRFANDEQHTTGTSETTKATAAFQVVAEYLAKTRQDSLFFVDHTTVWPHMALRPASDDATVILRSTVTYEDRKKFREGKMVE